MVRHPLVKGFIAVATLLAASWAQAECKPEGQKVGSLVKEQAPTYSESGKVVGKVEKAAVAKDTPVVDCNESLGLIKIHLASGDVWLDRTDANIVYTQAARTEKKPCIMVAQNKKDDQKTLGVAGAGSEHCEPGKLSE